MERIGIWLPACILMLAFASHGALAGGHPHAYRASSTTLPVSRPPQPSAAAPAGAAMQGGTHARKGRQASSGKKQRKDDRRDAPPAAHAQQRVAVRTIGGRGNAMVWQKAAASEQFERDARAQRLYRSSQFSAPIIKDAKACRRIGAHGESIYENC